jgi:hypothetical protein
MLLAHSFPTGHWTPDFIAYLDGAYRMKQGLVPHRDFAMTAGIWTLIQAWIALELQPWAVPFITFQMAQWLTVAPIAVILAARQTKVFHALFIIGFAAISSLVPYIIETEQLTEFSYHVSYNRLTTCLLFLTAVWVVSPASRRRWDACLVGALLVLLLATKITGFVVGCGFLVMAVTLTPAKRPSVVGGLIVFVATGLVLQEAYGLPSAYGRDILRLYALNQGQLIFAAYSAAATMAPAVIAAACFVVLLAAPRRRTGFRSSMAMGFSRPRAWLRVHRALLSVMGISMGVLLAESQNSGNLGMAAAASLLFLPVPMRGRADLMLGMRVAFTVACVAPWLGSIPARAMFVLREPTVTDPAVAWLVPGATVYARNAMTADAYLARWKKGEIEGAAVADGDAKLEPAIFVAQARTIYAAAMEARQRGFVGPATRVMSLTHVEYFARAMGAASPQGISLWHDLWRAFGAPPESERAAYLRNADAIFANRCDWHGETRHLEAIFQSALDAGYRYETLTDCWGIWLRR